MLQESWRLMDNYFLEAAFAQAEQERSQRLRPRFARVTAVEGGKVRIQLDGEKVPRQKLYLKAGGYTPAVGDRVYLVRVGSEVGGTYFVIDKITK